MRGAMKFMKRAGIYKASNVTYNPESGQAYSYDWWRFVDVIGGKVVFNDYRYSPSTGKHQSKVRRLLSEQGIDVDIFVSCQSGLQNSSWKVQSIQTLDDAIASVNEKLANSRRKKALDGERLTALNDLTKKREELSMFINSLQGDN